jgi:hypothetical protein
MTRKAILIEASTIKKHDDLPGARADVKKYKAYLQSAIGGAWMDSEISVLSHPTKDLLSKHIKLAGHADYAFVAFSGHGYHAQGKDIDESRLCINDTEEIAVFELNPGCARSLMVADSCRKLVQVPLIESAEAFQLALNARMGKLLPNPQRCRVLFDHLISEADKGPIYFYSCDLDEAAGETEGGGYFTQALLDVSQAWAESPSRMRSFPTNDAFQAAAEVTTRKNRQQNPKMQAGRRRNHFPFAVFSL